MEESGRGAAVEQLTARGMLSIPAMGGNRSGKLIDLLLIYRVSIPAMGGNSPPKGKQKSILRINPRNGGQ